MPRAKIAVTLDEATLTQVGRLVDDGVYPNRSRAIEAAVREKLSRLEHTCLALELHSVRLPKRSWLKMS